MSPSRPARRRVPLPGISSRAWEHPADRGALVALRKLRGFDSLIKRLSGFINERAVRLVYLGSAIRVDERQFPTMHHLLGEVAATLDAPALPELYVAASPYPQAITIGMDKPIIVVSSGMVDLLDEEEMRFVLGHEMGHVGSGHAVYQTLLQRLIALSAVLTAIPLGGLTVRAILAGLMEWSRKAELSADRAGLLAMQDPAVAFRVHMKLASGGHLEDLDHTSFFAQGAEYTAAGDLRDSLLKLMLVEAQTHPFAVVRAAELRRWIDAGEYTKVLTGDYPRREDDATADVSQAAQDAAQLPGAVQAEPGRGDQAGPRRVDLPGLGQGLVQPRLQRRERRPGRQPLTLAPGPHRWPRRHGAFGLPHKGLGLGTPDEASSV